MPNLGFYFSSSDITEVNVKNFFQKVYFQISINSLFRNRTKQNKKKTSNKILKIKKKERKKRDL